ncbi:MAG: acyltransferase [Lachnospiraceae bacterium]|nr:acyltransferase [Lachnospiraceae bacterium]
MHYLFYPALLILLFWRARICKKGQWNDEVLSYSHTKAFLGYCAILILFHHASQRTCAPWLMPTKIHHGLDAFVFVGYLCVAAFFFCSGYGVYTAHFKEGFFDHFTRRRILPVITPMIIMWLVFFIIEKVRHIAVQKPVWLGTYNYIWYVPAMVYLYYLFYLSFRLIKKEWLAMTVMILGTMLHFLLCMLFGPGTWWYNTPFLFVLGIVAARHKEGMLALFQKIYPLWLILSFVITLCGFAYANYYSVVISLLGIRYTESGHFWGELIGQLISAASFVWFVLLAGMKIRIGNPILKFLGSFTLEFYLVHPLFIQLFGFAFVNDMTKPIFYIRNQFLYVLLSILLTIPLAYGLHLLMNRIWKRS